MNIILPFMIDDGLIRGRFVKADDLMSKMLCHHTYPPLVEDLLAEAVLVALMLSSSLKYEGLFTMQVQGDGALSLLVVEIASTGTVRASVRYDEVKMPSKMTDLKSVFGQGVLVFTVDQVLKEDERYQGVIELKGPTLTACVEDYFRLSEQMPASLLTFQKRQDGQFRLAGLMLQQMPDKQNLPPLMKEDAFETALVLMQSVQKREIFEEKISAEQLLFRLFHANQLMIFPAQKVFFECRCSQEKVEKMLLSFSKEQLDDMAQEGQIKVTCQFCGKEYVFNRGEVS